MTHYFYKKRTKFLTILSVLFFIVYVFQLYNIINLPNEINIINGETINLNISFPFTIDKKDENVSVRLDKLSLINKLFNTKYKIKSDYKTDSELKLKFLGLVPIKKIKVNVIDRPYLIPGGDAIGVKLNTKGVLIVALSEITGIDGNKYSPGKNAGLKVGDVILEINNEKVKDTSHVIDLLNLIKSEKITIKIERNGNIYTTNITPVKCINDNNYRIGLWVRDKTAGIGTLTFYDENSNIFGALGHGITDLDTGKLMPVGNGEVIRAEVKSIDQGKKGNPGELKGVFMESNNKLGNVIKNTDFGIYGIISNDKYFDKRKPIPIATQNEIKEGKAYIYTTLNNNEIKKYEIEIIKKSLQYRPNQKSLVIKVTDKELLEKTGGIVQGMSGSPIIQDGKFVGCVTHVFVNDPTKGYGLYIEWMLKEAGINISNKKQFANAK